MACVIGCASAPPPAPVVIERKVYVFVPERSSPPVPPGPGIAESPLLVAAQNHRIEHTNALIAATPPPAPKPTVVYVGDGYGHGYGWRDPYPYSYVHPHHSHQPETTVVVVERDRGKREHVGHHGKRHEQKRAAGTASEKRRERRAERCGFRATKWARERCYQGVAR